MVWPMRITNVAFPGGEATFNVSGPKHSTEILPGLKINHSDLAEQAEALLVCNDC